MGLLQDKICLGDRMSLRELTRLNTDKDVEQQELSFIAGRDAEWHSHFGTVWQFLTKHTLTI